MANIKDKIIEETFRQKSYLIGNFRKPNTPILIPCWAGVSVSNPKFLKLISENLVKLIEDDVDLLCGIATTGISLASTASIISGKPWIFARGERKTYGSKEAFDGTYSKGEKVVFIDNLSAKGKGMISVFNSAKEESLSFSQLVTIVDYDTWEKVPEFNEHKVKISSLISIDELTDGLNDMGYFPGKTYQFIKDFLRNPTEWTEDSQRVKDFLVEIENFKEHSNVMYL